MSGGKVDIFMPIYIGDYMKDTSFLTTEQHGAYLLMLFACWQHGSIPNDDGVICSITKMSPDAWSGNKSMILRYFVVNGDNLEHNRISKELDKAKKNKAKAVDRAKKGADARWNKKTDAPSNASSNATSIPQAMLEQCPSPTTSPTPTKPTPKKIVPVGTVIKSKVPTIDEIFAFAEECAEKSGGDKEQYREAGHSAYQFYSKNMRTADSPMWKDGSGKNVTNWKIKLVNVWFDEDRMKKNETWDWTKM